VANENNQGQRKKKKNKKGGTNLIISSEYSFGTASLLANVFITPTARILKNNSYFQVFEAKSKKKLTSCE